MKVADKTYYLDAERKNALPARERKGKGTEGEAFDETPDGAAYLLVRQGSPVTDEMAEKYGVEGVEQEEAKAEAGIVTTGADERSAQGFVPAEDAEAAGVVVTGETREAGATTADEPAAATGAASKAATTKTAAKKSAAKK